MIRFNIPRGFTTIEGRMTMKKHRLVFLLFGIFSFLLMIMMSESITTNAATEPTTAEAYQNAPEGMKLDGYVDIPSSYKYKTGTKTFPSSSKLITSYKTNIVQMIVNTGTRTNQIGSFWGTIKDDNGNRTYNYFDLNKDQEISAWIYNGSDNSKAIDGFAFVLQNDPLGSQAISRIGGTPTAGSTLGVWGNAAGEGIKQSVALEFDRYKNDAGGKENYYNNTYNYPLGGSSTFIKAIQNQHISWGYAGDGASYTENNILMHRRTPSSVTNNIPMAGYDGVFKLTTDTYDPKDAWRHILINYKADTKTLYYKFNDKYPDGTAKISGLVNSGNFVIDPKELNTSDGKVYWGFTAATGSSLSNSQDVAMVMEKMPAIAEVKSPVDLHDLTTDQSSSEMGTMTNNQGIEVYKPLNTYDGDKLQFEYNVQYIDGISETGKINSTIALPENVSYSGDATGSIGSIVYLNPDGTEQKREDINKSQIEKLTVTVPSTDPDKPPTTKKVDGLKLQLDSLKDPKAKIQILVNGVAQSPSSATTLITSVGGEHTSYRSDNYSGDVISPAFTINNDKLIINNTSALSQQIGAGKSPKLEGTVETAFKTTFDGNDLVAATQIYDSDNKLISLNQTNVPVLLGSTQGKFDLTADTSSLEPGKTYTAKVTLHDQKGRVSNTLTYSFTIIEKELKLALFNTTTTIFERGADIPLNYKASYKTAGSSDENPDFKSMKVHSQIDGGEWNESDIEDDQVVSDKTFNYIVPKNTLSLGKHTVTIYLNDGVRDSNTVSYDFTVIENGLVLTPKEKEITVTNNDPVNLEWTADFSPDSGQSGTLGNVKKRTLQIRNLDQPDMQEWTDFKLYTGTTPTEEQILLTSTYDFTLRPIAMQGNYQWTKLLKEGRNEIRMSVLSTNYSSTLTSNEATTVINVPKLTLQVESDLHDYYSTDKSSKLEMFLKYNYLEDSTYTTDLTKMPVSLKTKILYKDQSIDLSSYKPQYNDEEQRKFQAEGAPNFSGLVKGETYPMYVQVSDPYGRVSNNIPINFHYLNKYLSLNVDDSAFEDVKYNDAPKALIHRDGNWNVSVDSAGSVWNLYAQSDGLSRDGFTKDLVFVDENGLQKDMSTKQNIWSRTTAISGQSKTDDITKDWSDDEGILLRNDKPDLAGEYSGQINWSLEDVPK